MNEDQKHERIEKHRKNFGMTATWLLLHDRRFEQSIAQAIDPADRAISAHTVKLVAAVIVSLSADPNGSYPSHDYIRKLTGLASRTVHHSLRLLQTAGYIEVVPRFAQSNDETLKRYGLDQPINRSNIYKPVFAQNLPDHLLARIPSLNADCLKWARDTAPEQYGLTSVERLALFALVCKKVLNCEDFDHNGEYCSDWPKAAQATMAEIAGLMSCHEATARRAVHSLADKGAIEISDEYGERSYVFSE